MLLRKIKKLKLSPQVFYYDHLKKKFVLGLLIKRIRIFAKFLIKKLMRSSFTVTIQLINDIYKNQTQQSN